jgi:NADP-dependent aldehyde dehydrogenase
VPDSLTATIHSEPDEVATIADLTASLEDVAGRLVFNGYPTGVRVSWGQHHGGPWPATNTTHTSVGVTAIRRFLRPVAWQDAPADLLPIELRDNYEGVPRRVDGVLRLAKLTK